jgi:hypothetical protein
MRSKMGWQLTCSKPNDEEVFNFSIREFLECYVNMNTDGNVIYLWVLVTL